MSNKAMGITAVVVLMVIIGAVSGNNNSSSGSGGSDNSSAASACHDAVQPLLAAPATAHFHDDAFTDGDFGDTKVTGEVDSENGFGALLTSIYTCDVGAEGDVIGTPTLIDSQGNIYGGDDPSY